MEARIIRALLLLAVLLVSMGARRSTPNFVVETADPQICDQIAQAAENYRRDLAISWLGSTMPDWSSPCVMTVAVAPNLGAGGATTFVFDRGEVYGWRMTIQGSAERVLDSVLPHEITHMIYASYFRHPVPRWADEGGATSVEHSSEKAKHRKMLIQFLQTGRGIAFNQMFAMTEYPRDVMPLYAQGYSLAEYLIDQGGRRKYVQFLADGMKTDQWGAALQQHYGISDLGTLQNTWVAWVGQGFPVLAPRKAPETAIAATTPKQRPEPNLILRLGKDGSALAARPQSSDTAALPAAGWHPLNATGTPATPAAYVESARAAPVPTQVTHPQPVMAPSGGQ